ncbi:NB-ARC - like 10 [Theobroma cacao]|nr:NB-ARC - like 10 [Theobroma cacao]
MAGALVDAIMKHIAEIATGGVVKGRVARYRHLAVTIKNINKELDELTKEKDRYQLIKREVKQPRRVESTSLVDVSKLHGREEVKKDIMNKLLCRTSEKGEDIQTISVIGMGGIGKTSLAQLIYNDDEVRTHFHKTMTTRKESVATVMKSSHKFSLERLSDDVCWLILNQIALEGTKNEGDKTLQDIGWKVVKKCQGLPLGGLLRDKTREEWENVMNSEIWNLNLAHEYIFTTLLLSYYGLPSAIRRCLLHCAIFPKNYEMWIDIDLIPHWMALGYLNSGENSEKELKGDEYFKCLAARSFFQDFQKDEHGTIYSCKMHDIVHDFVAFLTKKEVVVKEVNSVENLGLDSSSVRKVRHLSLTVGKGRAFPLSGAYHLRSLVVTASNNNYDVSAEDLRNLFCQSKRLRLLEFGFKSETSLVAEKFLKEMRNLIHLRYLKLSNSNEIKRLPEAVCDLCNLQVLDLFKCRGLEKLPDGIGRLINLRHLSTEGCNSLQYYPKGIGRLTSLRVLFPVIASADGNDTKQFSVGDLENLDLLRKSLWIKLVGNAIDKDEIRRAKLQNKTHLNRLYIKLEGKEMKEDDVIAASNPPPTLGVEFTSLWMS